MEQLTSHAKAAEASLSPDGTVRATVSASAKLVSHAKGKTLETWTGESGNSSSHSGTWIRIDGCQGTRPWRKQLLVCHHKVVSSSSTAYSSVRVVTSALHPHRTRSGGLSFVEFYAPWCVALDTKREYSVCKIAIRCPLDSM